jgi:hypothetical protein
MANGNNTSGDSGGTGNSGASYSSGDVSVYGGFGAGNTNTTNADYSGQTNYDVASGTFGKPESTPAFPHTPTPSPSYDVTSGTFTAPPSVGGFGSPFGVTQDKPFGIIQDKPIPSQTDSGFGAAPSDMMPWAGAQYPDIFFAGTHIADLAKGYTPAKGVPAYFDINAYGAYLPYMQDAANLYGLDLNKFIAQMFKESRFNPFAISPKNGIYGGAVGIGQIEPATAQDMSLRWGYNVNPNDPITNIYASARYMSELEKKFASQPNFETAAMQAYSGNTPGYAADVNRMADEISKVNLNNFEFPTSLLSKQEIAAAQSDQPSLNPVAPGAAPSAAPTPSSTPTKKPGTVTIPGIPGFTSPTTITLPTLPSPDTVKTAITNVMMGGSPSVAPTQSGSTGFTPSSASGGLYTPAGYQTMIPHGTPDMSSKGLGLPDVPMTPTQKYMFNKYGVAPPANITDFIDKFLSPETLVGGLIAVALVWVSVSSLRS